MVNGVVEQGVRTSFNFARKGVNVDVVRRLSPALRVSGRYSLSSTRTFDERLSRRGSGDDRPSVSAGAPVGLLGRARARHARRPARPDARHVPERRRQPGGARARRPGRIRQDLRAGVHVPSAAGAPAGRLRVACRAWPCQRIPARGPADRRQTAIHFRYRRSPSTTCRPASDSSPAATRRFAASRSTAWAPRTRSARRLPDRRQRRRAPQWRVALSGLEGCRRASSSSTAATSSGA